MSELLNSGRVGSCLGDFTKLWDNSGLLDGIETKESKRELAYLFEVLAYYLITGHKLETFGERYLVLEKIDICKINPSCGCDRLETLAFPIVKRVFALNDNKSFNIFNLIERYMSIFGFFTSEDLEEFEEVLNSHFYNRIDGEAEICSWFCDYYFENITNERLKKRILLIESKQPMIEIVLKHIRRNYKKT